MEVKVTEAAIKRIKFLMEKSKQPMCALRVAVNSGGCSGFAYDYSLTNTIEKDDYILEVDGVKIAIDPMSQDFINGSVVDFVEELGANYFQIVNPNASAKCGCGNSFSI